MKCILTITLLAITLLVRPAAGQTPGAFDAAFDAGSQLNSTVNAVVPVGDGTVYVAGDFVSVRGAVRGRIARLNADGTAYAAFNSSVGANGTVYAMSVQSDGKVLIAGSFDSYNGTGRNRIARLNSDGSLDTTFNPGTGANSTVGAVAVQADGKVVIGGNFTTYNGTARNYIARLNSDGSLDTTFNPSTGPNAALACVAVQSDGKVIIGGGFTTYNSLARNYIARVNSDGTLDTTFTPGTGADGSVGSAVVLSDGKVLIAGYFSTYKGTARNYIARVNSDGSLDTTFDPGTGASNSVTTVAVQADGKVLIGGNFASYNGTARSRIARINSDGSLDTTFAPGTGANGNVNVVAVQSDSKVLLGGTFGSYNGTARTRMARINSDGSLDTTFNPSTGANSSPYTLAVQADGKVLIGGAFTSYNGTARNRIARLNSDGSLDTTFDPGTGVNSSVTSVAVQSDGKVLIAGPFTTYNGTARSRIARLNSDGSLDTTFNPGTGANSSVLSVAVQSDGKVLIAGAFTTYNGTARSRIARLNSDGSLDTTFNSSTGANSDCNSVAVQADGKVLIGGYFSTYNGTARNYIARINSNGSLDTTFNPGTGANSVYAVAVQADGKVFIGGPFTTFNGTARSGIARLNSDGSLDTTFTPGTGANSDVGFVVVQADGKVIIGGNFSTYNGTARSRIARINSNGSLDTAFDPGTGADSSVYAVAVQADGKVLIAGGFTAYNGNACSYLARASNDAATLALTASSAARVQWLRGGAAPEVEQVTFDLSTDGGGTWAALGSGTRQSGGWELTGLALPASGQLRATGRTTGGQYSGSSGLVAQVAAFTMVAAPTVTAISPTSGTTLGGTSVTITGTNFTGATGVTIGGTAATGVTVVSDTTITATTPAGSAGTASVVVTTPGGSNAANTLYTYVAPPTVTSISPTSGSTLGGTSVTLTGTSFTGATGVTFGGAAATSVSVVNDTTITATTPAGSAGTASVVVTTPGGSNAANTLYTYVAPPTVTSISPTSGTTLGGTSVTITGTNLTGATGVTIGGVAATSVVVSDATTITAVTPAGTAGTASVLVTTPYGTNAANSLYTYIAFPTVTSISPANGSTAGGTSVTLTGTNFTGATSVTIGGAAATSVVVSNATTITAVTPAGTAGTASVVVTTPSGSNAANSLYTYAVPDYIITTTGNAIVVTDSTGNADTLTISEPSAGNINFAAAGRNFTVNNGSILSGDSGTLSLTSVTSISVDAAAGADTINVGAFTGTLPNLTLNGGTGNDTVNFNGDITFASNANLDVDLQNDNATPGIDAVNVAVGANVIAYGTGTITVRASQNATMASGSSLETVNGAVIVETNQQATPTTGTFGGFASDNGLIRATGSGSVTVNAKGGSTGNNFTITLDNGAKILGGTSGTVTVTGRNVATGGFELGLWMNGSGTLIGSAGADVVVQGFGSTSAGTGSNSNTGLSLVTSAAISAGGAGTVTVSGTAGGGSTGAFGVFVGTGCSITSAGGNVQVTGTGGGTASGSSNPGVMVGGTISAAGGGNVTVTGVGGPGSGGGNYGVLMQRSGTTGTIQEIKSATGNVTVTGTTGGGTGSEAIKMDSVAAATARITTSSPGLLTLIGDKINLVSTAVVTNTGGTVTLRQQTNAVAINLGSAVDTTASTLELSDAELDLITAGTVVVGDANSGTTTISAAITHPNTLSLITGAGLTASQSLTMAVDKNLTVSGVGAVSISGAITATGTGAISLTTAQNIALTSTISTVNGNLTLSANQQATPTTGDFFGVNVNAGLVQATGTGIVTVSGKGGTTGTTQFGVYVQGGGDIIGGTTGTTTVTATGGASANGGNHYGLYVTGAGSTITSGGANVSVTGQGVSGGSQVGNHGVAIFNGGQVNAGGSGTVSLQGTGAATSGFGEIGVYVDGSGSAITSSGGNVQVIGTGGNNGSTARNYGVYIGSAGVISSTGSGTVTVQGTAPTTANGDNTGVKLVSTGSQITSGGGDITITGTHGTGTAQGVGTGIWISGSTSITTAANGGNVTLIADRMNLLGAVSANSSSAVTLRQKTNAVAIDLGSAVDTTASTLELSDTELDTVTAGSLIVGDANSGLTTITAVISPASYPTLDIQKALTFSATGGFSADLTSATVFEKLKANGAVIITAGASLTAASAGGFVPTVGGTFTILNNVSASTTTGSFSGKPEGTTVAIGGVNNTLSYVGGTGNDVVFTTQSSFDTPTGFPITYAGVISGANNVTKTGADVLTLSGLNTYTGSTNVQAGTLSLNTVGTGTNAQSLGAGSTVNLGVAGTSSGSLLYTGGAGTLDKTINALGNGANVIQNSGSGLLTLSGTLNKAGTTLTLKGGTSGITVSGVIAGNTGSPNSDLVVDGGTVTLTNANTYNGPTYIRNSGTLNANATDALPTANGRTAVTFDGTGTSVLSLGTSQSAASLTSAGAATVSLNANTLTLGAATGSTTFAGIIGGTGNLIKDGASTQILTGANSYTGTTTISAGTLQLGQSNSSSSYILNGGALQFNYASANYSANTSLTFNTDATIGSLGQQVNLSGTLNGNNHVLTIDNGSSTNTSFFNQTFGSALSQVNIVNGVIGEDGGTGTPLRNAAMVISSGAAFGTYNNITVNNNITLNGGTGPNGNGVLQNQGAGAATYSGTINLNSGNSSIGTAGGNIAMTNVVSGGGSLTKIAANTLTLSGTNTYTGTTTVSAGVLNIQSANALGTTAAGTSVTSGAALQIQGSITTAAEALTLNGTGVSNDGALRNISGTNSYAGLVTLGSATRINSDAGTLTLSNAGTISGSGLGLTVGGAGNTTINSVIGTTSGTLTKDGTGTLVLSGNNTYSGATTISGGTLQVGAGGTTGSLSASSAITDNGSLVFNRSDNIAQGADFSTAAISGTGSLTQSGAGFVSLSAGNTYTGGTNINSGELRLNSTIALPSTGAVSVTGAGGLFLNGGAGTYGGVGQALNFNTNSTSVALSMQNNVAITWQGTVALNTDTKIQANGTSGTLTLSGNVSGSGTLIKSSGGNLILSGTSNSLTGGTTVNKGTVTVNNGSSMGTGALTLAQTAADSTAVTLNNATQSVGSLSSTWTDTTGTQTQVLTLNGTALTVNQTVDGTFGNGAVSTLTSTITGTGSLIKQGAAKLTLTGANTYTGATTISAGTLQIGAGSTTGSLSTSSSITNNATLAFNRSNTITQGTDFAGVISGSGAVTQAGTGTLVLSGTNTYTGATTINSGGTLQIGAGGTSGSLSTSSSITDNGTLTFNRSNTVTQGTDFASVISGSGAVTQAGTGTLVLSGANTYTGATTVSAGNLTLQNQNASSFYSIASGATLEFNTASTLDLPTATFSGAGTLVKSGSGTLTWAVGAATFSMGSGSLIDVQAGTVIGGAYANEVWTSNLSNLNVATGAVFDGVEANVRVNRLTGSGTIKSGYPDAGYSVFTFGVDNGSGTFSGSLVDSISSGNFTKVGTGTQVLSGANTYTGATTISAGTLQIGAGGTTGSLSTSSSITDNGALIFNRSNTVTQGTHFASVISGSGTVTQAGTGTLVLSGTNTYTGATTINSGGTLQLGAGSTTGSLSSSSSITDNGTLTFNRSNTITQGTDFNSVISGSGGVTQAGSGTLVLNGSNTFTGTVNVNSGTIELGNKNALGANNTAVTKINIASGGTVDLKGTIDVGYGYTIAGTGATGAGALINTGSAIGNGFMQTTNLKLSADATIGGTGDFALIASGYGATSLDLAGHTLTKSGTNTFTLVNTTLTAGSINIANGTIAQAVTSQIGSSVAFSLANTAGATLSLSSFNLSVGSLSGGGTTGGNVTLGSGTLTLGGLGTTTSYAGVISGSGALIMTGSGTQTLSGANTYTGATTISGGTLQIGAGSTTGSLSASSSITNNATLVFNRSNTITQGTDFASVISGSGAVTQAGTGTLVLSGTNTYTGATTISAGTLQIGAGGTTGSLSTSSSITNNGTLTFNRSDTVTQGTGFASVISGSGAVTQAGTGTLVLSGTNTYTGATTINSGGTLQIGAGSTTGSLSTSSSITDNGTLSFNRSNTITQGTDFVSVISGSGAVTQAGTGTLVLSGTNTYTGATTINSGGTLQIGAGSTTGALSTSSSITDNGTLTFNRSNTITQGTNFASVISGSGAVTQTGTGILVLSGNNTYTGATTVSTGILSVQGATALGTTAGGTTVSNGATLQLQGNITVGAEALSLNGGVASGQTGALVNVSGTNTYGGAITVTSSSSISAASGSVLNLTGGVIKNGTTATFNGGGTINISTVGISGASANSDLIIDGTTVNLNVANTYNGPTYIRNTGTLNANVTDALPTANGRTAVTFDGTGTSVLTLGAAQSVASLTSAGAATLTLNANTLTVGAASGSTSFAGIITGTGGLTKDGNSTQILTNLASTFSGNVAVQGGTLQVSSGHADSNNTSALGLPVSAGRTITVSSGATLQFAASDVLGSALATPTVSTIVNGGTLTNTGSFFSRLGPLTLNGGTLTAVGGFSTGFGSWGFGSTVTVGGSAPSTISGSGTNSYMNLAATTTFNVADVTGDANTDLVISAVLANQTAVQGNAAASLVKTGAGTLTLSGLNTYTGLTDIQAGTLILGPGDVFQNTGIVRISGGTFSIGIEGEIIGGLQLVSGSITGTTGSLQSGSTYDMRSGSLSAILVGSVGMSKTTTGTVIITSANQFTGATSITAGTLQLDGSLASASTVGVGTAGTLSGAGTVNGNATLTGSGVINFTNPGIIAGTLGVTGGNWNGAGSVTGAVTSSSGTFTIGTGANLTATGGLNVTGGTIASGSSTSTITGSVNYTSSSSSTFAGVIAGSGKTVTMNSTGATLTLSGTNTYTGLTSVSAGTLQAGASNVFSSSLQVAGTGTLALNGFNATASGNAIAGTGGNYSVYFGTNSVGQTSTVSTGAGSLILNGDLGVDSGAVGTNIISGNIDLGNITPTVNVAQSGTPVALTISGVISHGAMTKTGAGTLILTGANTYAGRTSVNAGTLQIGSGGTTGSLFAINSPTGLVVNGTLAFNRSDTITQGTDFGTVISGSGTVKQIGGGTLVLNGANTYTGATTVSTGALNIQNGSALGTTAAGTSVASGAALQIQGDIVVGAEALTLSGTGVSNDGALRTVSGTNTYGGLVTLGSATRINTDSGAVLYLTNTGTITGAGLGLTVGGAGNTTIAGIIGTGTGTLSKDGAGDLYLTGANTYTGTTTISGGRLVIGSGGTTGSLSTSSAIVNNATLAFWRSDTLTQGTDFASVISGSGTVSQAGVGTTILNGANTYTGTTTVSTGVLNIQNANALGGTATGTSVASGAALQIQGSITTAAEALTLNGTGVSNDGALRNISGTNTYAGLVTLGSAARINSDAGVLTLSNTGTITGSGFGLTVGGAGDTTINSIIGTGSGTLTKDGTGIVTLTNANTYAGTTTVSAGILKILNATALGTTAGGTSVSNGATLQLQGNITIGAEALSLNGGAASGQTGALVNVSGTNSYGGAITVTSSSSISAASGSVLNLTGGVIKNGTTATFNGGGTVNISTVGISGASANSDLVIDGTTVNLNVANTYNGPTYIRNGSTLNANVAGALPTGTRSALTFDGTGTSVLTLGAAQSVASLTAASTATITLNANTITIGDATSNTTFAGAIGGTGGLTKDGASTQVLSGSNGYSGTTTVSAGTLSITGDINSSTTIAVNGGVLSTSGADKLANTAAVTVAGGTLSVGGADTVGAVQLTSGSITGTTGVLTSTSTYDMQSGNVSAILGGSVGLNKTTSGTVTLSGTNTYTGATLLSAGNLVVNGSIGSSSLTTINGGTLMGTGTVGAIQLNSGGTISPGGASSGGTLNTGNIAIVDGQLHFNLGGTGNYGQINTTGTINLAAGGAGAKLVLDAISGYTATLNNAFTLVSNDLTDAISGAFVKGTFGGTKVITLSGVDYVENVLGSNYYGRINYSGSSSAPGTLATAGNDIILKIVTPEITITESGSNQTDGGTYNFGDVDKLLPAVPLTKTFTIKNDGEVDLMGIVVNAPTGAAASDYTLDLTGTASTLIPGASTTFTITFNPSRIGTRAAAIVIDNNDLDENPFNLALTGVGAIARNVLEPWTVTYSGPDAPTTSRDGAAAAVAVQKSTTKDEAVAVFATGYTSNASGTRDIYTAKYDPVTGVKQWQRIFNGAANGHDEARAIAVDGNGDVVIAGYTTNSTTDTDAYVAKYAGADGALLWQKIYAGAGGSFDGANSLAVDSSNNVAVAGYGTATSGATLDMWAARYSSAGAVIFERLIDGGGSREDIAYGVAVDTAGNLAVAGTAGSASTGKDFRVLHLAAGSGSTNWLYTKNGSTSTDDLAYDVAFNASNQVVATGTVRSTNYDFYTVKLSSAGGLLWEKLWNSSYNSSDASYEVAVDGNGDVIVGGSSYQNSNVSDGYVAKYNGTSGALVWDRRFVNSSGLTDGITGLDTDVLNNVVATGYTGNAAGNYDVLTAKLLADDGGLLWQRTFNGTGAKHDLGLAVAVSPDGDVYVGGYSTTSTNTTDFLVKNYQAEHASSQATQTITFANPGTQNAGTPLTLSASSSSGLTVRFAVISGPAQIDDSSNTLLNFTGSGSVTVRASQSGSSTYAVATPVDQTFTVGKNAQTINFALPATLASTAQWPLTGVASSGLAVTYSVQSGPGTISGGILTFSGAGDVTVRASQAGDVRYDAAPNVDAIVTSVNNTPVVIFDNVMENWRDTYVGTGDGVGSDLALQLSGNDAIAAFVTGYTTTTATGKDLYLVKYLADGTKVWSVASGTTGADEGLAVIVDGNGDVIVSGYITTATGQDVYVAKHNGGTGAKIWSYTYNGPANGNDVGVSLALDGTTNVVVGGYAVGTGTSNDFFAAKLSLSAGSVVWTSLQNRTTTTSDIPAKVAVGTDGTVALAGASGSDAWTVKLAAATGVRSWQVVYNFANKPDAIRGLALDAANNVIIAAYSQATNYDMYTAKYAATDGTLIWGKRYNSSFNSSDAPWDMVLDGDANVYITGTSYRSASVRDGMTLKYAGLDGTLIWESRYNGSNGANDENTSIALDGIGNPVVGGYTTKADATTDVYLAKFDKVPGTVRWQKTFDGDNNKNDSIKKVKVDPNGNVWMTGSGTSTSNHLEVLVLRDIPTP